MRRIEEANKFELVLSIKALVARAVCTENLNPHIMVMKSTKDRV